MKKAGAVPAPSLTGKYDRILALTALFEDSFSIDWIVELMGGKALDILTALEELVKAGWLKRKRHGIYIFSNIRKPQMERLLSAEERDEYHRRIAVIMIEEDFDEERKAKSLSHYLLRIANDAMGCRWLKKAGDFFLKDFNAEQSLKCYLKVIHDLSALPEGEESAVLFMETVHQYVKTFLVSQKTANVQTILQAALEKAIKYNKPEYEALIKIDMAKGEWLRSRYDRALGYFKEGRAIAERLGDDRLLGTTNKYSIFFYYWQGRHKEVIKSYEKFVPEVMRFPDGRSPLLGILTAGFSYVQTGQLGQGLGLVDAFRRHCRGIGDRYMESGAISGIGVIMLYIQKQEEAIPHFENGMEMSIREGNSYMAILCRVGLALCHHLKGENDKAAEYLRQFVELSRQFQINSWPHSFFIELCWAMEQGNLPPIPGISLKEEVWRLSQAKSVFMQGLAYRYKALLERKEGSNGARIMRSLKLSLKYLEESGSAIEAAKSRLEIARQYVLSGREKRAKQEALSAAKVLSPLNEEFIPDDLRYLITPEDNSRGILLKEILGLGQEIVNIRESRDLVLKIISSVSRITGAERGAIFLWDGRKLEIKASKNLSSEEIFHPDFSPSMKVIEDVAQSGAGCIRNVNPDEMRALSSKSIVRTMICVPLVLRDQIKGVLYHDNRLLGSAFKKSDLELLAYFAAQAAIALDNVTSYEEMQKMNQKLTEEKNYFVEQYRFSKISIENIIGQSAPIKRVMQQIEQVADTDANVLILGDTGVGKELVASAVHQQSPRRDKPFICVQCSALPEKLLPSELFGHEKGAFTGALKRRIGRFELADRGTIFLDEIGDLRPDMQVQLLRVLETKQFERIGGSETLRSDFRVITATNRDLKKLVAAGHFRRDLYYRLNVFPIHVPTLLERKEDIPLLVDYFVRLYAKKLGKTFEKIAREDLAVLLQYDWPGNIRELENIVERAVILNHGRLLRFSGVLPSIVDHTANEDGFVLSDHERRHIIRALEKTNGKVRGSGGAAELLGINPSTLFFRMKQLNIKRVERPPTMYS